MFKNIILTGFMGVGKTSIGTRLASDLGYTFVNTDDLIEDDQKTTITEIFAQKGEPYFRDVEARVIRTVLENENQVVSTGGGAVIRDENREAFKKAGLVVCLTARPEVIYERIKHETHRPLLKVPDTMARIRDLLESRAEFYGQADLIIDTSEKSVDEAVLEIKEKVRYARC
ncbi:MAG TPA: shikimate kinase [Nitrospirota bacterium]|nr:shikimate kinase [Nitrospirota bacterium]